MENRARHKKLLYTIKGQEDFLKQIQSVKRGSDSIVITRSVPGLSLSSFPRKSRQEKCHKKHVHRSITEFWMLLVAVYGNSYHDKHVSSSEQYVDSINCRIVSVRHYDNDQKKCDYPRTSPSPSPSSHSTFRSNVDKLFQMSSRLLYAKKLLFLRFVIKKYIGVTCFSV